MDLCKSISRIVLAATLFFAVLTVGTSSASAAGTPADVPNFPTVTALKVAYPTGTANLPPLVAVTGNSAITDGNGGLYWYNAADATSTASPTIIVDGAGRRWYALNIKNNTSISNGTVTPIQFGAFCNNASHTISSGDISANMQWVGTYTAGDQWDFVGIQEAIYAAYATAPHATFTGTGSGTNLTVTSVTGTIHVGDTISGTGAGTNTTIVSQTSGPTGGAGVYVTSQATTSSAASMRTIVWNNFGASYTNQNKVFYQPPGFCLVNRQVVMNAQNFEFDFAARGSSRWTWNGDPTISMFYNNAVSYGVFNNVTLQAGGVANGIITATALWVMDHTSGTYSEVATQQLTINNAAIFPNLEGGGISISPSGGAAQGDTIVFNNLTMTGFGTTYGVQVGGQNALSIVFLGGDIQGVTGDAFRVFGGTVYIYGMNFENQSVYSSVLITPSVSQILNFGADFHQYSGCGSSCISTIKDVRSESDVLAISPVRNYSLENSGMAGAGSFNSWFSDYCYQIGMTTRAGSKGHIFMVVDDGGNGTWKAMNTTGGTTSVITDPTASYTINQWATGNYCLFFRFGSNGFTEHDTITANTATTVTIGGAVGPVASTSLYHIGGDSGSSPPAFDSATPTNYTGVNVGLNQGFTTTANSANITIGSGIYNTINVNDYVVIPNEDTLGAASGAPVYTTALIAKVTAKSGGNTLTVNKAPKFTTSDAFGYWGTPFTDGRISWLDFTYPSIANPAVVSNSFVSTGVVERPGDLTSFTATADNWLDNLTGTAITTQTQSLRASRQLDAVAVFSAASTTDMSPYMQNFNVAQLVPTTDATLNAPVPAPSSAGQLFELDVVTNVTTPFTLTFGTNFVSSGPLYTGVTSGSLYVIQFRSLNGKWVETYRSSSPSQPCPIAPTLTGNISNPTVTYTEQTCYFTKNKNIVTVQGHLTISAITGGSGNVGIAHALPVTSANTGAQVACTIGVFGALIPVAGNTQVLLAGPSNGTGVSLFVFNPTTGVLSSPLMATVGATFDISYSCTYQVA